MTSQLEDQFFNKSIRIDLCDLLGPRHFTGPVCVGLLTLFGAVGNIALLCKVLSTTRMRTTANVYLVNMAIGSLLYIACTAPFYMLMGITPCMDYCAWVCKLRSFIPVVGQSVCIYSLAALSRERYLQVVRKPPRSRKQNALTICLFWLVSITTGIPVLVNASNHTPHRQCSGLPVASGLAKLYETYRFLFLYLFPVIAIAMFYCKMACKLRNSMERFDQKPTGIHQTDEERKNLTVVISFLIVFFIVFWLPYYVYILWFEYSYQHYITLESDTAVKVFRHLHYLMTLINCCLTPWCVFAMSSSHRVFGRSQMDTIETSATQPLDKTTRGLRHGESGVCTLSMTPLD